MEAKITRWVLILAALLVLTIAVAVVSMALGPANIGPDQVVLILLSKIPFIGNYITPTWSAGSENIVVMIRLPRVLLGLLVGASLGLAGVTTQGVFKNPMADPYILGISSGAALGASAVILIGADSVPLGIMTGPSSGHCWGRSSSSTSPAFTTAYLSRPCCCQASQSRPSSRRSPTSSCTSPGTS